MADNPSQTVPNVQTLLRDGAGHWSLDREGSSIKFGVKHFWGAITVHGRFENFEGEGTVGADGTVSGQLIIDAKSLTTKMRKRDEHLRSADFFDVEHHPNVTITLHGITPDGERAFRARVVLEAAGRQLELEPIVELVNATSDEVTLRTDIVVDRTVFDMTWSPLRMASKQARAEITARFVRR
jgi:polyisoprenoid-binding protein YceI